MSLTAQTQSVSTVEDKRALLADRLRRMAVETERTPLSFCQQRLWFLDQLQPGSPLYNVAAVAKVTGRVDKAVLEKTINAIVARHEALRTRFEQVGEMPVQVVDREFHLRIDTYDVSALNPLEREERGLALVRKELHRPFDLSKDLLIRVVLIRDSEGSHILAVIMHHIISDEWSLKVFFAELSAAYEGFIKASPAKLPELPIQYSDFAAWQRKWMRGEILEKQLAFWKKMLAGDLPNTELPSDRPRNAVPQFKGGSVTRALPASVQNGLRELAEQEKATLYMVLLTGFKCLVSRYTGSKDVVIGSPIAGRNRLEAEGLIGFFVNTLPLRTDLQGDPSFREALRRVRKMTLDAYAHQDLPFDRLVEEVRPERSLTHMPFTSLMFSFQSNVLEKIELGGISLEFMEIDSEMAKFDFTLTAQATTRGLILKAEYDVSLFDHSTAERILEHYENLLSGACAAPDTSLSALPLMSADEQNATLRLWSRAKSDFPCAMCIHEVFEEQVARNPDVTAIQFGERRLTYGELNNSANQVAHYVRDLGIGPNDPVAICARRSPELIVGILGILKAGGAYVPLDPNYPKDRLEFMLRDTGATVLLTEQGLLSELPETTARTLCLDSDWEIVAAEPRNNPVNLAKPDDLAYVMYTSGSTGTPKGVCIPHKAVNRLVLNTNYIRITSADRIAQVSNVSFDAATFEIWGALLNGAELIKIGKDVALSPAEFGQELQRQNISALFLTTALFNQLANDSPRAFASVGTVMFGGETCDINSVRKVLEQGPPKRLLHVYGPTENTTFSTWHEVDIIQPGTASVPIGIPIANTEVYVLDQARRPVPVGVPGELYVGGDGLAQGYWKRGDLTEQCFVKQTFETAIDGSERLYKTGDLVRWLPSGKLEFLGRIDNQVKIRGFRVEPGEIESVLSRHSSVRECAVTVQGTGCSRKLVGYIVPREAGQVNASEIRTFLKRLLPDYMVPAAFVTLEALPLTPNGKVNRKSLPAPDQARPELEHGYVPPRDDVERKLTTLWESVLGVRPVGVQDKFFDLGGHSLMAVRLVSKIEKTFGRKLRLATIFQAPTIEQLASVLREDVRESSLSAQTSIVEIQAKGTKPPMFLVHGAGGGMFWGYVNLSKHLGTDQPLYGFRTRGLDGLEECGTIEELATQYVQDLRRFQPKGPYYLGGYCFGGNVAYEMACQLEAAGEKVAMVALINSSPANSTYMQVRWTPIWAARLAKNMLYWGKYCMGWSATQRREFIAWKWGILKHRLLNRHAPSDHHNGNGEVDPGNLVDLSSYSADQKKIWETHIRALIRFHPKRFSGAVHLLRSGGHPLWCSFEPDYGWGELARGGVHIVIVPGAHEKVLEEPCVQQVAENLGNIIGRSGSEGASFSIETAAITAAKGAAVAGLGWFGAELAELANQGMQFLGAVAPAALLSRPSAREYQLAKAEEQRMKRWNNTRVDFDCSGTFISHFQRQVLERPDAVAVRHEGVSVNYRELNDRTDTIATHLSAMGVRPGGLVAVCLARSIDLVATLLAIWKNGAAYLPLDPNYPRERINYMLEDSRAKHLVTGKRFRDAVAGPGLQTLVLEDLPAERIAKAPAKIFRALDDDAVAYVIYTSGSTGRPKGVEITHRSLLNHNYAVIRAYALSAKDRVLQFSPISFDISVEEIFPTLLVGGSLVMRTEEVISSVGSFFEFARAENITTLNLPTAYWHEITEHLDKAAFPECVRLVVIGGEKASDEAFRKWKRHLDSTRVTLINSYGPTETTVSATYHVATDNDEDLPIGKPLANVQLAVLDADLRRVAVGETGELFIGGHGLARGYLNRPELTAERFVENPFKDISSPRLYRTGDLVRFRQDGNLEFVGRTDNQVKIRGFRIELGEIEGTLLTHPKVRNAVVLSREDKPGQKKLVAYVVGRNGVPPHITELLEFLRRQMPAYMVPSSFVVLQSFPMTPAGKIDRLALPAPGGNRPDLDQEYVAPRNPIESAVGSIYQQVLEFDKVGVLDNFFDLGGHSLAATQIIARIRELFRLEVALSDIFAHPTIAAISDHIESIADGRLAVPFSAVAGARRTQLTLDQMRIWFLDQYDPRQSPYNIPVAVRLNGSLDYSALNWSLGELFRRHEALRAVFPEEQGAPAQYICAPSSIAARVVDLSSLPADKRNIQAAELCSREGARNYITYRPVLNPTLIRLDDREHILLVLLHRIAADGASQTLLLGELAELYDARTSGRDPVLAQADSYLEGLQRPAEEEANAQTLLEEYWKNALTGAPALLDLPSDRSRVANNGDAGARVSVKMPHGLACLLASLERDAEPVLFAAFFALLHRYTNSPDLVIGTTRPTRERQNGRTLIGPFEDYLVLRQNVAGGESFATLVGLVSKTLEAAREQGSLPFSRIVEILSPERNTSYTPVFQVLFQFEDETDLTSCPGGVSFVPIEIDHKVSIFDVSISVRRRQQDYYLSIQYSTDLFDGDRIERMARHFSRLLSHGLKNPDETIARLSIIDDAERELVLSEWNGRKQPYASEKTLIRLFDEQVNRSPDAEALVVGDERFSYRELKRLSACMANKLRALGVGTGQKVALCMERSRELLPAILGTFRTGAAYVPIDPFYPRDRIELMLTDSKASVLVTRRHLAAALPRTDATVLCIEDVDWQEPLKDLVTPGPGPRDVAYVIYTSGSTGKPKGVMIEHRNAAALVHWARDAFDSEELSGVLAGTSVCFDLSIFELFAPLCWGGRVILAGNVLELRSLPAAGEVRLINTVPSAIRELVRIKAVPPSVCTINLAGEPLASSLVDQIYAETKARRVLDLYGPTETTTYSTCALRGVGEPATIGQPLPNEQVYLLDSNREPVPIGIPGEAFIGGAGVAKGYLNRPDLTAERFVENPFVHGELMYRTGDIARWRKDGMLEYLGRIDNQVKIRGFRVELGEIEAALRSHPAVSSAVVVAREGSAGEKTLAGYVTAHPGKAVNTGDLQVALEKKLPSYMVPAFLMVLEALPLTPNGKVDRRGLPKPETSITQGTEAVQPRTEKESILFSIWKSILPLTPVSVRDNFFELGGHSLLAIQICAKAREALQIDLPLFSVFDNPTVEELAKKIDAGEWGTGTQPQSCIKLVPRSESLPASFVQERLWFLDQLDPGSDAYNVPVAVRIKGGLEPERLERAFHHVLERHEVLRSAFALEESSLVQQIVPELKPGLQMVDLGSTSPEQRETKLHELLQAEASRPFDLASVPLLRGRLFRLTADEHVVMFSMHHTISDGWSLAVFFRELEAFYLADAPTAEAAGLQPLRIQYADFAAWQRRTINDAALEPDLNYWRETMRGAPEEIIFPGVVRGKSASHTAERLMMDFPETLVAAMSKRAHEAGATPFAVLMTALAMTLYKWTGQDDLVIGTVVAGRGRRELEDLIGCFMNFLPIRARVRPGSSAKELLADMRNRVLEAQAHQECPFEKIVEALNPARKGDNNPLYNVGLLWQNFPHDLFEGEGLEVSPVPVAPSAALLDLRFEAEQRGKGLELTCEFRSGLFTKDTIEGLLESLRQAVETLVQSPDSRIEQVQAIPAHRRDADKPASAAAQKLAISGTFTVEPVGDALNYWIGELGARMSVEFAPYNQVFQELLAPSSLLGQNRDGANVTMVRLEDWLRDKDSIRASSAKVELERNLKEFVRCLKSLAERNSSPHIVCICPPSRRLEAHSELLQFLSEKEEVLRREADAIPGVHMITSREMLALYPVQDFNDSAAEELGHVPYSPLFYTALGTAIMRKLRAIRGPRPKVIVLDCDQTIWSGVCGEDGPTGIRIDEPWRHLQEFMRAQREKGMLLALCSKNNPEDVEAVFSKRDDMPLNREDFAAVRLNWLPKSENLRSIARELNLGLDSFVFLDDNPVECAEVEAGCPEVLTLQLPDDPSSFGSFLRHCWVFDHAKITSEDKKRAEMYRENTERERLRNQSSSLADFIAGLDLKVRIEPMVESEVARVSQLTQRTNQFNLTTRRRTELEIRNLLPGQEVLTVSVNDRFGDYGLVGVMIYRRSTESLDVDTLLLSCRVLGRGVEHKMLSRLGELALDRRLRWVDLHYAPTPRNKPALDFLESAAGSFKQHANGSLLFRLPAAFASEVTFNVLAQPVPEHDIAKETAPRQDTDTPTEPRMCRGIALVSHDIARVHKRIELRNMRGGASCEAGSAPTTPMERLLGEIWCSLLRRRDVGTSDNFFDLGGHSLLAVRLFAEIARLTGKKFPLITLFQAPTIRELAAVVQRDHERKPAGPEALIVPIQPTGSLEPLFLVHGAGGDVLWGYANLASHLGQDRPVYGIKSRGQVGLEECPTITEMAACYVEAVRSKQPHGPYYLGGYCFGGNVAYEMARLLRQQGEKVAFVALLDSSPSNAGYEDTNWKDPAFALRFARNAYFWLLDFMEQPIKEQVRFVGRKARVLARKVGKKIRRAPSSRFDLEEIIDLGHFPDHELRLWQTHIQALVEHVERPYEGSVVLFRTRGQPVFCSFEDDFCWSKVVRGGVRIVRIPGSHENIFMEPNVRILATEIAEVLVSIGHVEAEKASEVGVV